MIHEDNKSKELYDSIVSNTKDWYKKFIKSGIKQNMKTAYYIQNKKEGKFIYKYLGIKNKPFETGYVIKTYNGYTWSLECPNDCDDTVSVKILMALNNQTLEKRISKLESKVEGLINKQLDWIIPDNNKELTELPEKWCVKHSKETLCWIRENSKYNGKNIMISSYYFFPENIEKNNSSDTKPEGYTEISFSDFERLVLKNEEYKYVEAGRWYKEKGNKYLFFISKIEGIIALGYGFSNLGSWFNDYSLLSRIESDCHLATTKEVEEALKNEAVKRGFRKGINIKTPNGTEGTCKNGVLRYDKILNYLFIDEYSCFVEGKWAEIVKDNNDEIDWSIPGQIVKGEYTTAITTGKHNNSLFEGFVIKVTDGSGVNHLCKTLIKEYFSIYEGEITLKN